jgi:tetratricopeptide (TPR) repeat protein
MRKFIKLSLVLFSFSAFSQGELKSETQIIPTYGYSDPNPMPALAYNSKIYPYHKFEGYSISKAPTPFHVVSLENEYILVEILPELGGKVWGAIDKSNGNEFIYKNDVLKFRDIAMRGPWTSGGIEFNFGIIGHHPSTASKVDFYTETLGDGTQVCVVGTMDLPSRTQWRVRIALEPNVGSFSTQATWYNPSATEKAYYNWMTAAAVAKEDLVFATPGNAYLKHDGTVLPWPNDVLNRDLSHYNENNFGSSKSYHIVGTYNDFFGGYYEKQDIGFGHWGRYDEIPGQKLWLWDLSRFGGIWEDLLTDKDGQYIEYQAGRLFVQYFPGAENPISQATFESNQTDQWKEVWFPLKNTKGLKEASPYGALNVIKEKDSIKVYVNPFKTVEGKITFQQEAKKIEHQALFRANKTLYFSFKSSSLETPFSLTIDSLELNYNSEPMVLKRPFKSPKELKGYKSNTLLFEKGLNAQRYRNFEQAKKYFEEVLNNDPSHLGARAALGALLYDSGLNQKGLEVVQVGLGLDTYHPDLNYTAGINYLAVSDLVNAKESLGWAARSMKYRSTANTHLSQIALLERNYKDALHYANQALNFNTKNITALSYRYLALKASNRDKLAEQALKNLKTIDPLHHLISFELYLDKKITLEEVKATHRSEFPYQSFLELAILYYNTGFNSKALTVLETSPKHMLTSLWMAFISKDNTFLKETFEATVDFVFPFRRETASMLQWVNSKSNHWKASYLFALNLIGLNQKEKGRTLLNKLNSQPNTANFYWIRSQLATDPMSQQAQSDLEKAYEKDPKNWRIALDYGDLLEEKNLFKEALHILDKIQRQHPDNFRIGLRKAVVLNSLKEYEKSIDLLSKLQVLPYEHATGSRKIYTQAYWGSTINAIQKERWNEAKKLVEQALKWPEQLGVGKPFDPEERLSLMFLAFIEKQIGSESEFYLEKIVDYSKKNLDAGGKNCAIGLFAIMFTEGKEGANIYAKQLQQISSENPAIQQALAFFFTNQTKELSIKFLEQLKDFIQ